MKRKRIAVVAVVVSAVVVAGCVGGGPVEEPDDAEDGGTGDGGTGIDAGGDGYRVEVVADGFTHPWGMDFLPNDTRMLVTERDAGTLVVVDREDGATETVEGTPDVYTGGQGGMLDVEIHPDFPDERWVYLTYSATNDAGESATHLGRGELVLDGADSPRLDGFEVLHVAEPFVRDNGHFGSRVVFGDDGMVYMTTGDRQDKTFGPEAPNHVSQDRTKEIGSVLRLEPDGTVPEDNPFVDDPDARDSIYSYGHRNAQGLTVHPETGELWESEYGERDGDEINILQEGENYGWPVADEGCKYGTREEIGVSHDDRDDVVAPVYSWSCGSGGFPPGGMTFYTGDAFPDWQGDLFVGNLAGRYLGHFEVNGTEVRETDPLLEDAGWRIRDVEDAPDDGYLYVLVDDGDAPVVRLVPD